LIEKQDWFYNNYWKQGTYIEESDALIQSAQLGDGYLGEGTILGMIVDSIYVDFGEYFKYFDEGSDSSVSLCIGNLWKNYMENNVSITPKAINYELEI